MTLDPKTKGLLDKLAPLKLNVDSKRLGEVVETGKALAHEEGFPDYQPGGRAPGIPQLPPGTTLDLTHPTISLPGVPEFKIPDILSVSSGSAVIGPGSLRTEDWIVIAKNNNLLRAYTLDDPPNDQSDPPTAATLALDYMVPTSADFFVDMHLQSSVLSEVTYSSATASYVRSGFDTQSASLSIPYAAASFERQRKEREAKASTSKTVYMIGRWYYPRARLYPEKFTKASTRFTAAVEAAVNANDPAKELEEVFNKYGRAVPKEVVIGGQLSFVHKEVCAGSVNETEVEQTIKAAVSIKSDVSTKSQAVQADAGISFGSGSSSKLTAEDLNNKTQFAPRGGDATLAGDPKNWPNSVKDPKRWAVIGVSKLAPITDWLEPDLRARVERFLPAIQVPQEVSAVDHSARADSDGFISGVRSAWSGISIRGGLQIVCGTSGSPALGQGDAVGASATYHGSHPNETWIDGANICLPVPKGSHYFVSKRDDYRDPSGQLPGSRFTKTETKLTFGKWETLADQTGFSFNGARVLAAFAPGTQDRDGFIFCSVRAPGYGDRGFVSCTVDGKILGAASVHDQTPTAGCWSPHACFCVPVPRHLPMSLDATTGSGKLDIKVWYLASTSKDWKFGKPEPYALDALHTAETDGFLNGVVTVREGNNARGMLHLFCGPDGDKLTTDAVPPATIAVHQVTNLRYIPYASAMLPVRRGFVFRPVPQNLSADPGHKATVEAYWTPLLIA